MNNSQKILTALIGFCWTFLLGIFIVSLLAPYSVKAFTTYQTENANQSYSTEINEAFAYEIPAGISFDRIQIYSNDEFQSIFWIYDMNDVTGEIIGESEGYAGATFTWNQVGNGVYEVVLPLTKTFEINQALFFTIIQENVPVGIYSDGNGYQWNGIDLLTSNNFAPTIKLCNGACDNNAFNPLPELTASPWIKINTPLNGAVTAFDVPFQIQSNTGTSSADNVRVVFNSNFQSIIPYEYELFATGLRTEDFIQRFPSIDDQITIQAFLYASTTIVASSSVVTINAKATPTEGFPTLGSVWDQVKRKPPFGYIVVLFEELENINGSATPRFDFGDIPFLSTVFTPIRDGLAVLLWGLFGIYFYKRLTKLDI